MTYHAMVESENTRFSFAAWNVLYDEKKLLAMALNVFCYLGGFSWDSYFSTNA